MKFMDLERKSGESRREDEKLNEQFGNVGIRNGMQLTNHAVDQIRIISLLNKIPTSNGGTLSASGPQRAKDPKNGICDSELHKAILNFQRLNFSTLGIIDGWISPTGRTLKLLKAMAEGKGLTTIPGNDSEKKFQELLAQLQIIVTNGRQLINPADSNFIPIEIRGQLNLLITQLERDLAQANKGKPQGTLPVRNAAPAIGLVVIIVAAAAAATFVALISLPGYRKAFNTFTSEAGEAISIRVQEFKRLMGLLTASVFSNVLAGINAIQTAMNKIKAGISSCGPKFAIFETVSNKINIAFRTQKPQSVLEALMKEWITAFSALMFCLQQNNVSPIELLKILSLLHTPVASLGITLFDAITKLFLKGFFPPANLLKR